MNQSCHAHERPITKRCPLVGKKNSNTQRERDREREGERNKERAGEREGGREVKRKREGRREGGREGEEGWEGEGGRGIRSLYRYHMRSTYIEK